MRQFQLQSKQKLQHHSDSMAAGKSIVSIELSLSFRTSLLAFFILSFSLNKGSYIR